MGNSITTTRFDKGREGKGDEERGSSPTFQFAAFPSSNKAPNKQEEGGPMVPNLQSSLASHGAHATLHI